VLVNAQADAQRGKLGDASLALRYKAAPPIIHSRICRNALKPEISAGHQQLTRSQGGFFIASTLFLHSFVKKACIMR
jgi:hypothetical protein